MLLCVNGEGFASLARPPAHEYQRLSEFLASRFSLGRCHHAHVTEALQKWFYYSCKSLGKCRAWPWRCAIDTSECSRRRLGARCRTLPKVCLHSTVNCFIGDHERSATCGLQLDSFALVLFPLPSTENASTVRIAVTESCTGHGLSCVVCEACIARVHHCPVSGYGNLLPSTCLYASDLIVHHAHDIETTKHGRN